MFTPPGNAINEIHDILYVVEVNGILTTTPASKILAEQHLLNLSEDDRSGARLVQVTQSGKHVLLE